MPNTNCLKDMRCPHCGSYEPFNIEAQVTVTVYDTGTDDAKGFEWSDDSWIECLECYHEATVGKFFIPPDPDERI